MHMETKRLILRPFIPDDAAALHAIFSDAETMRYYPAPFTEEKTRQWIERNLRRYREDGFGLWAVVLKETGQVIGDCGITLQPIHGQMLPEIGYHIHKAHQRMGYAAEAARFCVHLAFDHYGLEEIYCYMKHDNWPSMGVAGKMGMVLCDIYPDPVNQFTRVFRLKKETKATRQQLADTACRLAKLPLHGSADGKESNLQPLVQHFRRWDVQQADRLWCAAFVYHCCVEAGFQLPFSPDECTVCSLAGVPAWEELAQKDSRIGYFLPEEADPLPGDIVLYDHVFCNQPHDHIGIVLENHPDHLITAEGNIGNTNRSGIIRRAKDGHIRCYIRLPENYRWFV
ncbi:MAG: GNAT family N-acetyltransferase [Clostridia bacterium]|nr:GNAT family N-acetyltransferase [Clostridia bacterium]